MATEILELKHHVGGGTVSDTHIDLWRTINVWLSALSDLDVDELPRFTLVTTARAADGSTLALLREDDSRNPDHALSILRSVATDNGADATREFRRRFADTEPHVQEKLIRATVVRDQEPQLDDLDQSISDLLVWAVRPEHREAFIERLKGWWYARCVDLLRHSVRAVSGFDLIARVHNLRDSFQPDSLPFDFDVPAPTEEQERSYWQRICTPTRTNSGRQPVDFDGDRGLPSCVRQFLSLGARRLTAPRRARQL